MNSGQQLGRRLRAPISALLVVGTVGTLAYVLVEDWSITDAVYMVVISVTTVGFREVHPLSGTGQWITVAIVITGLASTWYMLSVIVAVMIEGELRRSWGRRRMDRRIGRDRLHYILCGYGRIGREIGDELRHNGQEVVVIDNAPAALADATAAGFPTVAGDATDDDVLMLAGLERAAGLITTVASDADNVFVTLSAHSLYPDLRIVARAIEVGAAPKLRRAGATHVISPYALAGRHIAQIALRPAAVGLVETLFRHPENRSLVADVTIAANSAAASATVAEVRLRFPEVALIALQRGEQLLAPLPGQTRLAAGDVVAVVAPDEALHQFRQSTELPGRAEE